MPVVELGVDAFPSWSEVTHVRIVPLAVGETRVLERIAPRERLVVALGRCRLETGGQLEDLEAGSKRALDGPAGRFVVKAIEPATLVWIGGRWGDETGGYGVFTVLPDDGARERGDPTDYVKRTALDNHYHDCDEYWIVVAGRGIAVSEGRRYEVGPGDCVVTGMGHHHDFPEVSEPVRAVYFETTLAGERRRGHLWNHTHGQARPDPARV